VVGGAVGGGVSDIRQRTPKAPCGSQITL
jgi:hypothetical protein